MATEPRQVAHAAPGMTPRMTSHLTRSTGAPGLRNMFQITIPLDDVPPPFHDSEVNKNYELLQTASVCRTGGELLHRTSFLHQGACLILFTSSGRVPTPERMKVFDLASGLDKHRLRRQQQLLLDIAQRLVLASPLYM